MNLLPFMGVFEKVFGIVDQLVVDKDAKLQIQAELRKIELSTMDSVLKTSTVPWVDATVKLLYASVSLFRPVASIGVFIYGLMNPETFSTLSEASPIAGDIAAAATFGAAPAWGVSRHREKAKSKDREGEPWSH